MISLPSVAIDNGCSNMNLVVISFDAQIQHHEIQAFRGAINNALSPNVPLLFHNHTQKGLNFSYPRVQYKIIDGKASSVLIGEAASYYDRVLALAGQTISISGRPIKLNIAGFKKIDVNLCRCDTSKSYFIENWCPLNVENHKAYTALPTYTEKREFLRKVLVGNILSMSKGLGVFVESRLDVSITDILKIKSMSYKNMDFTTMDIVFQTNFSMPAYIGLGKHTSVGFGTLSQFGH